MTTPWTNNVKEHQSNASDKYFQTVKIYMNIIVVKFYELFGRTDKLETLGKKKEYIPLVSKYFEWLT